MLKGLCNYALPVVDIVIVKINVIEIINVISLLSYMFHLKTHNFFAHMYVSKPIFPMKLSSL